MKLTDLFIRRPVLAIVVNLVILIAGLQSIRSLERAPVPAQRHRGRPGHDGLHRRQRRPGARLHHHAARARDRQRRRHRLHRVVERPGPEHDHRAPEAQLRHQRGAHPDPGQGGAGAQRPAARGRGADHRAARPRTTSSRRCTSASPRRARPEPDHRLPDPRRAAASCRRSAACSAPTSSATAPSPCASGSSPTRWRRSASRPPRCATRWRATTTSRRWAGPRARWCRSTWSPTPTCRPPEEFRQLVVKETGRHGRAPGRDRRRRARRRELRAGRPLQRPDRHLHGHLGAAHRQLARRDRARCARRCRRSRRSCPAGMTAGIPYDSTEYIQDAIDEVLKTLTETLLIVVAGDLPVPRLVARGAHPGGRDPDLADRRGLPHAGGGLHHQPADAARHRALGRAGGRRRDRHGRERRAPPARGQAAASRRRSTPRASWSARSSP